MVDPFTEGMDAFYAGVDPTCGCPYPEGSDAEREWECGFYGAADIEYGW